jgi:hypothetical protein
MTAKWVKAMQDALGRFIKFVHAKKQSLQTKIWRCGKCCETGSHAENKHT